MHYGAYDFSKNGQPTILVRKRRGFAVDKYMGQRHGLSKVSQNTAISWMQNMSDAPCFPRIDRRDETERTLWLQKINQFDWNAQRAESINIAMKRKLILLKMATSGYKNVNWITHLFAPCKFEYNYKKVNQDLLPFQCFTGKKMSTPFFIN